MESPFGSANTTFVLYVEPVRNNYYKTYQNIITVDKMPPGPLEKMVKAISSPKLSPFQQYGPFYDGMGCMYVLLRYPKESVNASIKNGEMYMTAEDIPSVLSYLHKEGYVVDTGMTKLMLKTKVGMSGVSEKRLSGDRRMICMVNYNN
tara:strand:+ start:1514 stop:1957 length:444 start_codon:yes stop_codon:yes gene_type:complete